MSDGSASSPLAGRVALVTGASSGIGEATDRTLAAAGAAVAIGARRADRLSALESELRSGGAQVLSLDLDVTDEGACRGAVDRARRGLGEVDILVNSAGLKLLGPIVEADTEDWRRTMSTNVLGLMYITHAVLPGMVARGSGDIVNISSVAGRVARSGAGVYNASKWAVNAFSESLRAEVTARGIRVSMIEPGAVGTELNEQITEKGVGGLLRVDAHARRRERGRCDRLRPRPASPRRRQRAPRAADRSGTAVTPPAVAPRCVECGERITTGRSGTGYVHHRSRLAPPATSTPTIRRCLLSPRPTHSADWR